MILDWLLFDLLQVDRWPRIVLRGTVHLVVTGMFVAAILMALNIYAFATAEAAPATPAAPTPISENCEQVATIGIIEYYFCESDYGDFFTNSFGFMLPPDY